MKVNIEIILTRSDLEEAYKEYCIEEIDATVFHGLIPHWYNKADKIVFIDENSEELILKQRGRNLHFDRT
jgi:hypothetical protein